MKTKTIKLRPQSKMLSAAAKRKKKNIYETDFAEWAHTQSRLLERREFDQLDIDNLREEIEDLSRRESDKLVSYLENLLMHELKVKYQPLMHTASWDASIKEARFKVKTVLKKNPSLKPKLKDPLREAYYTARLRAVRETGLAENTFPKNCPWKISEIFEALEKKYC